MVGAGVKPTLDNIHLTHSWIVSQYAGEYNPYHHHSGDFSAVIYLKIPPKMQEELDKEFEDHYPTNGLIEFMGCFYNFVINICDVRNIGNFFKLCSQNIY